MVSPNFRRNLLFSDYSVAFSSGAGIPLRLSLRAASSVALTTTKRSKSAKKSWDEEVGLKPELSVRAELSAAFELPGLRFGGQAVATAFTATEMRMKMEVNDRMLKLSLIAPERQDFLLVK